MMVGAAVASSPPSVFERAALNLQNPKWKWHWGSTLNLFCSTPSKQSQRRLLEGAHSFPILVGALYLLLTVGREIRTGIAHFTKVTIAVIATTVPAQSFHEGNAASVPSAR